MIRIKLTCNWDDSKSITKRLIEQFETGNDLDDIVFVYDDTYDLLVAFGYLTELPQNEVPIFLFPQEPTWSGGHQKTFNDVKNIKVFGYDSNNYFPNEIVEETIAHMFYGSTGPWQEGWNFWNYKNLTNTVFEKNKNICSFVSNRGLNDESYISGCLYGERIGLVKGIHDKTPYVDFYGWGDDSNLKPHTNSKGNTMKDYKFCLTIENSSENYYVSEKFYDCILTNTIPIYYGCKNIENFWNEKGYILLDSISDHKYVLEKLKWINENSEEIYKQMLPELLKMKKRYFEEFNIIKKIKKEFYKLKNI